MRIINAIAIPRSFATKLLKCEQNSLIPEDQFSENERKVLNDYVKKKYIRSAKVAGKTCYFALDEKTFEGMVAERLITFGRFPVKTYAKIRSFPWVKRELSGFGDFKVILEIYSKKRMKRLQDDKKAISAF